MQTINETLNEVQSKLDYVQGTPQLLLVANELRLSINDKVFPLNGMLKRMSSILNVPVDKAVAPLLVGHADLAREILAAYMEPFDELTAIAYDKELVALDADVMPDPTPVRRRTTPPSLP